MQLEKLIYLLIKDGILSIDDIHGFQQEYSNNNNLIYKIQMLRLSLFYSKLQLSKHL